MTLYIYKGTTSKGTFIRGEITAADALELSLILEQKDIRLVRCYPKAFQVFSALQYNLNHEERLAFFHHMGYMTGAGIGIVQALEDYSAAPKFRGILKDISRQIQEGKLLSQSIKAYPSLFSPLAYSLLQGGEKTGNLSSVFGKIHSYLVWDHKVRTKFLGAIRYPLFLFGITFTAFLFLIESVVPQLQSFLLQLNAELPLSTRILLGSIMFFKSYGLWILLSLSLFFFLFWTFFSPKFQEVLYKLPLFGTLLKNLYLARLSEQISLLMGGGIPLMEALQTSSSQMENEFFKGLLSTVISKVQEGLSLSAALKESGFFPCFFLHLVRAGENSDTLLESFKNIGLYYSQETDRNLERLTETLYPLCLLLIGAFLIWMILGIFYPLYESLSLISP